MAREGQHDAQLRVRGDAKSADREMAKLASKVNKLESATDKQSAAFSKMSAKQKAATRGMARMSTAATKMRAGFAAGAGVTLAIVGATLALDRFAQRAIDSVNVMTDLRFDTKQLSDAVSGMATQHDIAGAAALLQSTSLKITQKEMNLLFKATADVADKNKKDLVPSLNAVAKAIAKGNVDKLRALGLQTDNAVLLDIEAKKLGISTEQLTLAQKQTIAFREALRAMNVASKEAGDSQDGLAFAFVRLKNEIIDAFDEGLRFANDFPRLMQETAVAVGLSTKEVQLEITKISDLLDQNSIAVQENEGWFRSWTLLWGPAAVGISLGLELLEQLPPAIRGVSGVMEDAVTFGEDLVNERLRTIGEQMETVQALININARLQAETALSFSTSALERAGANKPPKGPGGRGRRRKKQKLDDPFAEADREDFDRELQKSKDDDNFIKLGQIREEDAATRKDELAEREVQRLERLDAAREEAHQADLQRDTDAVASRQVFADKMAAISNLTANVVAQASLAMINAEGGRGRALLIFLRDFGTQMAIQQTIIGLTSLVRAAALGAGVFTAPLAAPHVAAAVFAFSTAAATGAMAGFGAAGLAGMKKPPGAAKAGAASKGGGGFGGGSVGGGGDNGGDPDRGGVPDVPTSPVPRGPGPSPQEDPSTKGPGGRRGPRRTGDLIVNFPNARLIDKQTIREVSFALEDRFLRDD